MTQLLPYQQEGAEAIYNFGGRVLLADQMGLGKACAVSEKVLTAEGWIPIGRIHPGDYIYGSDGKTHRINGVYPQGVQQCYKVKFKDGAEIEVTKDHLWNVQNSNDHKNGQPWRTLTVSQLLENGLKRTGDNTPKWEIPTVCPLQFPPVECPLDPYLLGALLGNGCLNGSPSIRTPHRELIQHLRKKLPKGVHVSNPPPSDANKYLLTTKKKGGKNPLIDALRRLGVWGKIDCEKAIPSFLFHSSIEQRWHLLQGLMDTDGSVCGVRCRFSSSSKQLAEDVRQLVLSLGGIATLSSETIPKTEQNGIRSWWSVSVCNLPSCLNPFRIQYHLERQNSKKYRQRRKIVSITKSGLTECVCLKVASPDSLFVLGDYVLTHNTIQSLYWISKIPKHRPVVILCPASMKYTWQSEALVHFGMRTEVLEGHCNGTTQLPGDIVILNYDILGSWLPLLLKSRPKCVIIDECQFIKSLRAKRTKNTMKLTARARSILALSGTPLTNRPIELWPVLKVIRPDLFPSLEKFAWRYCAPKWTHWGWQFNGAVRLKELHRILRKECMIRRLKKDVLPQLPPKRRKFICFRLKPSEEKIYQEAESDFIRWLGKQSTSKAKKAQKAEALVKIGYLVRLAARLKLNWTTKWIEEFFESNPGEKLVAFTMHTFIIDHLREKFADRCVVIDGRVTGRKREESVRQFRSHRKKDLLLGNWIAAGVGLTLTAASNVVGLDLPWTPGELLQGEDRIHRIGQKKMALIHYLIATGTIEEKQISIQRRKAKILDAVLDGRRAAADLDIFSELINKIKQ